jgi:hypothetical protein
MVGASTFDARSPSFVVFDHEPALGSGSFGSTYEGLLNSLPVAAKGAHTLFDGLLDKDSSPDAAAVNDRVLADMKRDLDALAQAHHPNLTMIMGFAAQGGGAKGAAAGKTSSSSFSSSAAAAAGACAAAAAGTFFTSANPLRWVVSELADCSLRDVVYGNPARGVEQLRLSFSETLDIFLDVSRGTRHDTLLLLLLRLLFLFYFIFLIVPTLFPLKSSAALHRLRMTHLRRLLPTNHHRQACRTSTALAWLTGACTLATSCCTAPPPSYQT